LKFARARVELKLSGGAGDIACEKIEILQQAELVLDQARQAVEANEIEIAQQLIAKLEDAGWTKSLRSLRTEAELLRAEMSAEKAQTQAQTLTSLKRYYQQLPNGFQIRYQHKFRRLFFDLSLASGDAKTALAEGRRLLRLMKKLESNLQLGLLAEAEVLRNEAFYQALLELELAAGNGEKVFDILQQSSARQLLISSSKNEIDRISSSLAETKDRAKLAGLYEKFRRRKGVKPLTLRAAQKRLLQMSEDQIDDAQQDENQQNIET
jgi:hypothetical protein